MSRAKTVFVTGGSGFIAKHIIRLLLDEGYSVRTSVRSSARTSEIKSAMQANVKKPEALDDRLSFVELDLDRDEGWTEALEGVDALMHTASPFPMNQPKNEDDLIRPAVEGTKRALTAAAEAGVNRVIMTSSIVAIAYRRLPIGRTRYDESDWSDLNSEGASAYVKSKTLAEKAAWSFAKDTPEMALTVINPALVLGPALDSKISTSVKLIQRIMSGKDPMVPRLGFPIVDVRDVALMHVRALQRPESAGSRFIASERFVWFQEMASILKAEFPDHRIPNRVAPDILIKFMALFDKTIRQVIPNLGMEHHMDTTAASEGLGMEFIEARNAVKTAATAMVRDGLIR